MTPWQMSNENMDQYTHASSLRNSVAGGMYAGVAQQTHSLHDELSLMLYWSVLQKNLQLLEFEQIWSGSVHWA